MYYLLHILYPMPPLLFLLAYLTSSQFSLILTVQLRHGLRHDRTLGCAAFVQPLNQVVGLRSLPAVVTALCLPDAHLNSDTAAQSSISLSNCLFYAVSTKLNLGITLIVGPHSHLTL